MPLQLLGSGHLHCGVLSLWNGVLYSLIEALGRRWLVVSMGVIGELALFFFPYSKPPYQSVDKIANNIYS